ncbi:hypothetical protein J7J74_01540 [bacterium]|nr:hypothetical protein [bacterium]
MSADDWKIANRLFQTIGSLDRIVFLDEDGYLMPATIVLVTNPPPDEDHFIEYSHPEYHIFVPGIAKHLQNAAKGNLILLAENFKLQDLPVLTVDTLIVGIAAHEVRHRLQHFIPKNCWFSPDCSPKDGYMEKVVKFVDRLFHYDPPRGDFNKEFDAKVIEFAAMEYYWKATQKGKNLKTIIPLLAEIIGKLP